MLKSDYIPPFSSITKDPNVKKISPIVEILPVGKIIYDCLDQICIKYPGLRILRRIAMPDHIHFELFVTERTELPLGSIMAAFKAACTKKYLAEFPHSSQTSLFKSGFNDKIAFRAGAKDAFYNYIADNPRRYIVKKLCPEYFFHKIQISVNGKECGLYGNLFLLDSPVKSFIQLSRQPEKTPDYDAKIKEWAETIRSGGVLVSPFINPYEKVYRDRAIKNGNGIILVTDYCFSDKKKPYKELFDLCADGQILIISTEQFATPPQKIEYAHAQELNAIAAQIARLQPCSAILHTRKSEIY